VILSPTHEGIRSYLVLFHSRLITVKVVYNLKTFPSHIVHVVARKLGEDGFKMLHVVFVDAVHAFIIVVFCSYQERFSSSFSA
jgi:hypothetical protein